MRQGSSRFMEGDYETGLLAVPGREKGTEGRRCGVGGGGGRAIMRQASSRLYWMRALDVR
jgi:hypothetical protein